MEVIIMRGIPGSGKSTWANNSKNRSQNQLEVAVVSADNHFMVDGVYKFDPSKLRDAHNGCLKLFLFLLKSGDVKKLIVDNTNLTAAEIAPYYRIAEIYDADVRIVTVHCDFREAVARGTHGVPISKMWQMHQTLLSERLPPYWKEDAVIIY